MALKYCTFPRGEYAELDPSLYVVDYILELEHLEKSIAELSLQRSHLSAKARHGDTIIKHEILDLIAVKLPEHSPEVRKSLFRKLFVDFSETMDRPRDPINKERRRRIAEQIRDMYGAIRVDEFEKDFAAYARTDEDKKQEEALKEIDKKLQSLKARLEKHKNKLPACFKGRKLPTEFRGRKIANVAGEERFEMDLENLADSIVRSFAQDWRARAPLFHAPVSVTGTLIASMAPNLRELWQKSYDKLGLGSLVKRVIYTPHKEPQSMIKKAEIGFFEITQEVKAGSEA
ncbi:MAG: hypothetical protein E6Q97_12050 [Desulfurellales bacterium]|nr:MAG: hypothetical protein E6Q97_12050 [Desulfurellales bacterium]